MYIVMRNLGVLIQRAVGEATLLQLGFGIVPLLIEDEFNKTRPETHLAESFDPTNILVHIESTNEG